MKLLVKGDSSFDHLVCVRNVKVDSEWPKVSYCGEGTFVVSRESRVIEVRKRLW